MAERNAKAVLKVAFPIGINIADIIIHDDVFGDGVNVAPRVENECELAGSPIKIDLDQRNEE